MDEAIVKINGA